MMTMPEILAQCPPLPDPFLYARRAALVIAMDNHYKGLSRPIPILHYPGIFVHKSNAVIHQLRIFEGWNHGAKTPEEKAESYRNRAESLVKRMDAAPDRVKFMKVRAQFRSVTSECKALCAKAGIPCPPLPAIPPVRFQHGNAKCLAMAS